MINVIVTQHMFDELTEIVGQDKVVGIMGKYYQIELENHRVLFFTLTNHALDFMLHNNVVVLSKTQQRDVKSAIEHIKDEPIGVVIMKGDNK